VKPHWITEIGSGQRLGIVGQLKHSGGLSVGELAARLGLSYMGAKRHCLALARLGYLETFRRPPAPQQVGRPRLLYRLTEKADPLFPGRTDALSLELLQCARLLYGEAAPEKLLYLSFQQKAQAAARQMAEEAFPARLKTWLRLREEEGYLPQAEEDGCGGFCVTEAHSPLLPLHAVYPQLLHRLEETLWSRVLATRVRREQDDRERFRCLYHVAAPAA